MIVFGNTLLYKYDNGNAVVELYNNGTRIITYDDELVLEYPLNIDIRVSTKCSFGFNPKTNSAICSFCHESARTDGGECDYDLLKSKLIGLPKGIELAIGANHINENLYQFLKWCYTQSYVCNLTVNQGHINRDLKLIKQCLGKRYIKGLGISYRSDFQFKIPKVLLSHPNVVFHVIAGIDDVDDIILLSNKGVGKILILGEKDFGFNQGNVNLNSKLHKGWGQKVMELTKVFNTVSFDNLALKQLKIKNKISKSKWDIFYQHEHSIYINAAEGYFSPSSRSAYKMDWGKTNIKSFFNHIN